MKIKVGLIQDFPIFFELDKTIDKMEELVKKYSSEGCQLIVFPESFIPAYPRGFDFGAVVGSRTTEGRRLFQKFYDNSLDLKSAQMDRLERMAKEHNVFIVAGATIKGKANGSLYCAMLYIDPAKGMIGLHRKIKPTGTERLIWAEGDASDLEAVDSSFGKLGGLICWENYMPFARMAMYQQGVQIYIAPTADAREEWQASMKHIALEGRCFVLACNQYATKSMYPETYQRYVTSQNEDFCKGGSVIISPLGKVIAGPLFDRSGAVVAEIDTDEITQAKLDFDVNGHYSRPDLFNFEVNR